MSLTHQFQVTQTQKEYFQLFADKIEPLLAVPMQFSSHMLNIAFCCGENAQPWYAQLRLLFTMVTCGQEYQLAHVEYLARASGQASRALDTAFKLQRYRLDLKGERKVQAMESLILGTLQRQLTSSWTKDPRRRSAQPIHLSEALYLSLKIEHLDSLQWTQTAGQSTTNSSALLNNRDHSP